MKKKSKTPDSISTFLGPGAVVDGTLEFQGTIRLDGKVVGQIKSREGTLIIGEKAFVDAKIEVNVAVIMGEVKGEVIAAERIELYPPGKVIGDIQAPVISIDEGGIFTGNCAMQSPQTESDAKKGVRRLLRNHASEESKAG
jgi:cytoskeletal protein CcmA (bactofilin family)